MLPTIVLGVSAQNNQGSSRGGREI
jgi:hypothetical protein